MDRREAIKRVALLMGGVVSAPTLAGVLGGCRAGGTGEAWSPQVLSADQDEMVVTLSELIIPETDTPGARAAEVNRFVDRMLDEWYPEDVRDRFLAGLADVDERARQAYQTSFLDLTPQEQTLMLTELDREAQAAQGSDEAERPFFHMMKELTLLGYYTSEVGASQELRWEAAPGYYNGCAPMAEIGRAWA